MELSTTNAKYISFYASFFSSQEKALSLILECYELSDIRIADEELAKPRRVLNNIARLIGIADDLRLLKYGGYGLQIHFWIICIEAIANISNPSKAKKVDIIRKFFTTFVSNEDQEFSLSSITRSISWDVNPRLIKAA